MRSIYWGKPKMEITKGFWKKLECPSCGGPKPVKIVGQTVGGKPLYHCSDKWHDS